MNQLEVFSSFYAYPHPLYLDKHLKKNQMLNQKYANQTDFTKNLASNVIKLSVYLDTVDVTEIQEKERMSWRDLLGSLGGYFHLFLGMSLISFVEIVEFVCERKRDGKYLHNSSLSKTYF